jgi:hypothetical protein
VSIQEEQERVVESTLQEVGVEALQVFLEMAVTPP